MAREGGPQSTRRVEGGEEACMVNRLRGGTLMCLDRFHHRSIGGVHGENGIVHARNRGSLLDARLGTGDCQDFRVRAGG